jgi:hypothetical protein
MSNPTTNVPATTTMINDWGIVWQSVIAGNYVAQKRTKMLAVTMIVAYILACIFHATGLGVINIIIGSLAMLAAALYAAKPWLLAAFITGGGVTAISPTIDLGQGIYSGLVTLGRLLNAVMLFTGLAFFILGTYPLAVPIWMYATLPMASVLIFNIYIYDKMTSERWMWKFAAKYVIIVLIFGAISDLPIVKATLGWVNIQSERTAAAIEQSTQPGEAPSVQRVTWVSGVTYPLNGGVMFEGALPTAGATFDQPSRHCVNAQAIGGGEADYVPAGHVDNPWDRVLVIPKAGDMGKTFMVWAATC